MPRDGSGTFSAPAGTTATPNTSISSTAYNAFVNDLVSDANLARPVVAGGTGATTPAAARSNIGAAAAGANSDITALSGLTTPLSIAQGGTGANSAASARASISAPAIPTSSAGAGNAVTLSSATGGAAVLPAGGTWFYFITLYNTGAATNGAGGVAAGGTTVGAATAGQNWLGFAWRIA